MACWTEQGQELTYAWVTVLHFDDQSQGPSTPLCQADVRHPFPKNY